MKLLAFVLLTVLGAGAASAKPATGFRRPGERLSQGYESAQWFAFELKFGPYSPAIDSSPGVTGQPFSELFTDPADPQQVPGFLLTQLEFDFQFLHKVGSLGVGVSLGYYRNTAKSLLYADAAGTMPCQGSQCRQSGEETALNIIPIELLLVYRFDYLLQRWRVPLVPYMKVGLAYYFWVIQNGSGGVATNLENPTTGEVSEGAGGTWGFTLHPGLAFTLDIIDQNAARIMDAELGINHSHIFIEMNYANISNFGRDRTLVLSDLSFAAGLGFEF